MARAPRAAADRGCFPRVNGAALYCYSHVTDGEPEKQIKGKYKGKSTEMKYRLEK